MTATITSATHHDWNEALVGLYRNHFAQLVALARRQVCNAAFAEEVVQEAFLTFHSSNCQPKPGKELSYLRSMIINRARSATRRRVRGEFLTQKAVTEPAASVEDACLTAVESELLKLAIAMLSPRQQRVVTLRYVCGLSESETAAELQISPGSVKTHASRGREHLRRHLNFAGGWPC